MKVIKYIIELNMIYSLENRSRRDTIAEFDNFFDAITELENVARIYANNENVVIELVKYKFDNVKYKIYEFVDYVIGFYGVDAAKVLKIASKNKKFGLIVA